MHILEIYHSNQNLKVVEKIYKKYFQDLCMVQEVLEAPMENLSSLHLNIEGASLKPQC